MVKTWPKDKGTHGTPPITPTPTEESLLPSDAVHGPPTCRRLSPLYARTSVLQTINLNAYHSGRKCKERLFFTCTVIMREMAPGANGVFLYLFLVFFCPPRCHLTDGCHLTHTGAIMQLNDFIQGFARHPRCPLSDGCDAELVSTTHGLTRPRCCRQ